VPNRPTTIIEELVAAARGVAAIVVGDRDARRHFDFSQRGLVGSFIAFLVAATVDAYLPLLTGGGAAPGEDLSPTRVLVMSGLLFGVQVGASWVILSRMGRADGFVPYLVADNWASFYAAAASSLLKLIGVGDAIGAVFFWLLVLVVEINTARLILTLTVRQIIAFLVLQGVAVTVAFFVLLSLFVPVPPDVASTFNSPPA
jgi:hypothetical protein